jgi:hypothetical protein
MSAIKLRSSGQRRQPIRKSRDFIGPSIGLTQTGLPGESRLNQTQIQALEHIFSTHPAVQACRAILHGQLLSGGIVLRRGGENVELKPAFQNHLDETWLPFAADVVDSFLKFGYCVCSYEEDITSLSHQSLKRRREAEVRNFVPIVPPTETYEVSYIMGGRMGYRREYLVHATNPRQATKVDTEARVVVRQHPDAAGNVNSPLAAVFDLGSFVSALTELAMTAEVTNARPRIWTQLRKENRQNGLDPQSLFFDSEARGIQASRDGDENTQQATNLVMQQQMMKVINSLQTTNPEASTSFGGGPASKQTHVPPEVSPSLFCLPKEQEMAPASGQLPQARGDLESLTRLAIEQTGAAFGVPTDLIFQGRFAGKSTAQLSLLNTTVAQLAKYVNTVLTMCYRDLYGEETNESEPVQLQLLTSPLAATDEVLATYQAGLVPLETALPAVMHAIGASKDAIDSALQKAKAEETAKLESESKSRSRERELVGNDAA